LLAGRGSLSSTRPHSFWLIVSASPAIALNAAAARFNAARESFPTVLFADALGFAEAAFHRLDTSERGTVDRAPGVYF
jgi:hypothetical protein